MVAWVTPYPHPLLYQGRHEAVDYRNTVVYWVTENRVKISLVPEN